MTDKNLANSLSDDDFLKISQMEPQVGLLPKSVFDSATEATMAPHSGATPDSVPASKGVDEHPIITDDEELEPQPSSNVEDDYFDDDEEFLRGDDTVVHENYDIALFKQDENVVSWEIVNFYKDGGSPRSKNALRNDPPIMKISSSSGDTAEFLVTKEFSKSLGVILSDVNKAYYGISPSRKSEPLTQAGIKNKFRNLGRWMLAHKFKTAVAVVVAALLVTSLLS